MLNCDLIDSLKNLPNLFQKWFEYIFSSEQKLTGGTIFAMQFPMVTVKKTHCIPNIFDPKAGQQSSHHH
jgi:hypothetical protein